jgi:general secretion pathway protein A
VIPSVSDLFAFFSLNEDPFHVSPNQRFYFSTSVHDSALVELLWGIESRQGLIVLTGNVGTGKTTLIKQILGWLEMKQRSSAYIFHTCLETVELLEFILRDFGITPASSRKGDLVAALHQWVVDRNARGDCPVLILDEAQVLSADTLDELRLLLNLENDNGKLMQIILAGQPELEDKLRHPGLQQLRQRIMIHSRLLPLTMDETARYISSRLAVAGAQDSSLFPPETVKAIHLCSRGIPRIVNLLCKDALVDAYANREKVITPDGIYRIASELNLSVPDPFGAQAVPVPFVPGPPLTDSGDSRGNGNGSPVVESAPMAFADKPAWNDGQSENGAEPSVLQMSAPQANVVSPEPEPEAEPEPQPAAATSQTEHEFADETHPQIVRAWADASDYLGRYCTDVVGSFLRDCRTHVEALSAPPPNHNSAQSAGRMVGSVSPVPRGRKGFFDRVTRWLRQPVTPRDVRGVSHPIRAASRRLS